MESDLKKIVESLGLGDLVCCSWSDASVGKSSSSGLALEVPVSSWGIYVGLIGEKIKHIVLAQNSFCYSEGAFDLDYTAIPLVWTVEVKVLIKGHVPKEVTFELIKSFMQGGRRALYRPRTLRSTHFQQRLSVNGRPN
jgi:hypothetical protein